LINQGLVAVDVDFSHFDAPRVFGRDLADGRRQNLAGPAPFRPEIHEHGLRRIQHLFLKVGAGQRQDIGIVMSRPTGLMLTPGKQRQQTQQTKACSPTNRVSHVHAKQYPELCGCQLVFRLFGVRLQCPPTLFGLLLSHSWQSTPCAPTNLKE
jgi:hypothetical protein